MVSIILVRIYLQFDIGNKIIKSGQLCVFYGYISLVFTGNLIVSIWIAFMDQLVADPAHYRPIDRFSEDKKTLSKPCLLAIYSNPLLNFTLRYIYYSGGNS